MISGDTAMIKVFAHNDWVWMPVRMNHSDLKYIRKKISEGWACKAFAVEKRFGHYEMRFAMQRNNPGSHAGKTDHHRVMRRVCVM